MICTAQGTIHSSSLSVVVRDYYYYFCRRSGFRRTKQNFVAFFFVRQKNRRKMRNSIQFTQYTYMLSARYVILVFNPFGMDNCPCFNSHVSHVMYKHSYIQNSNRHKLLADDILGIIFSLFPPIQSLYPASISMGMLYICHNCCSNNL